MISSKSQVQSSNQVQMAEIGEKPYNLEDRTAKYGQDMIKFLKSLAPNNINNPLINQAVRSATSIGANYMEADGAESKKDFQHKISICKKEAKETMHWLRMLATANMDKKEICNDLWRESHELVLIFSAILKKK